MAIYAGRDFSPLEQVESRVHTLDLVNDIASGDTLTSATWTLIVVEGVDATPNSHLVGGATLVTPPGTSLQTATSQRISGLLPNVRYLARAVCGTFNGDTVSLSGHIQGEAVTQ